MFYDKKLMKSASVEQAWRVAHGFTCDKDEGGTTTLQEVCDKVLKWVKSDHEQVSRRLSLRASATLVAGTAQLYRQEMNSLLEDLQDLVYQKRFDLKPLDDETDVSTITEDSSSSTSVASPEEMRQSEIPNILQIDTRKRHFQPTLPGHLEIIKKFICSDKDDESQPGRNDDDVSNGENGKNSSSSTSVASPEEMRQSEISYILQIDTRKIHFQPTSPGSDKDDESQPEKNDDDVSNGGNGKDFSSSTSVASPEEMRQSEISYILQIDTRKRHFQPISPGSDKDDESQPERNDDDVSNGENGKDYVLNANIDSDDVDTDSDVINNDGNSRSLSNNYINPHNTEGNSNNETNKNVKCDSDKVVDDGSELNNVRNDVVEEIIATGHVTEDSFTPRSNEINTKKVHSKGTQTDRNESLQPEPSHNVEEHESNDINNGNEHQNVTDNLGIVGNVAPHCCILIYSGGNQIPTHAVVGNINTSFMTMLSSIANNS